MRRCRWFVVALFLIGCAGCLIFPTPDQTYGPAPVSPELPRFVFGERTVESLTPTLKWTPSLQRAGSTYDLIVYEVISDDIPWKEVYHREALTNSEHQMEEPLHPGKSYYWAVRVHHDGQVSTWSSFSSRICILILASMPIGGCQKTEYPFYIFKAPK